MRDLRRVGAVAIVFLVVMRISIGWQFLYEGLWKLDSYNSPRPWTSEGYLKNAQGPFRNTFRNMTGDPNDLYWLNYDEIVADWTAWKKRFLAHHPDLSPRQKQQLEEMLNGKKVFVAALAELPETVDLKPDWDNVIRFNSKSKRLSVHGERHLVPKERDILFKMVPVTKTDDGKLKGETNTDKAFYAAVDRLYILSSRLSYKERLAASLKGDPVRVGLILREQEGTIDHKRMGEIELYGQLLARYEEGLASAEQAFQHQHLKKQWGEIQDLRRKLTGPVRALDAELKSKAQALLNYKQLARGPVRDRGYTRIGIIDTVTIWSLLILGTLLIVGLGTRVAALAGAGMLLAFYLPVPPWPGVIEYLDATGPEHNLLVNKNLIQMFALLAIAAMPSGSWFGLDAIFQRLFKRKKKK